MDLSDVRVSRIELVIRIHQLTGSIQHKINRPECGIMFAKSGNLYFEHNGSTFILDSSHALFVPEHVTYYFHCEEECVAYVINFKADVPNSPNTFLRFDTGSVNRILHTLEKLDVIWNFKKSSYELRSIGMLYELLAFLDMSIHSSDYLPNSTYRIIEDAVKYIEQYYNDRAITSEELAKMSGVSEIYFRKLFTKRFGVSPMHFIKQKKIERAQSLLSSGYLTVSQVAEDVGFSCVYNFSKAFKKATGLSPSEYTHHCVRSGKPPELQLTEQRQSDDVE